MIKVNDLVVYSATKARAYKVLAIGSLSSSKGVQLIPITDHSASNAPFWEDDLSQLEVIGTCNVTAPEPEPEYELRYQWIIQSNNYPSGFYVTTGLWSERDAKEVYGKTAIQPIFSTCLVVRKNPK